jgi:hypothetical protein
VPIPDAGSFNASPEVLAHRIDPTGAQIKAAPGTLENLARQVFDFLNADPTGSILPAMTVAGGPGKNVVVGAKRVLSKPEQDQYLLDMIPEVQKIAGAIGKQWSKLKNQVDDIASHGYLGLAQALEKDPMPTDPAEAKKYLTGVLRNELREFVRKETQISDQEIGRIDIFGGIRGLADEAEEAASRQITNLGIVGRQGLQGVANPENVAGVLPAAEARGVLFDSPGMLKQVRPNLRSLARDVMRGISRNASIAKGGDKININKAMDALEAFDVVTPHQEFAAYASPSEIAAAIERVVKTSKSAKLRRFENPTRRYLLEGIAPKKIANGLGYNDTQFGDFSRSLQAVVNDVREILQKKLK